MKKLLSFLLCCVIIISFASCGGGGTSKALTKNAPSGEYYSDILGELKFVFSGDKVTASYSMWDDGKEASLTYKLGEDGILYFDGQDDYGKTIATEWNYRKLKFDKSADVISDSDSVFILMNTTDANYSLGSNALKGIYYSDSIVEIKLEFNGNDVTAFNSFWDQGEGKTFLYRLGEDGKIYFIAKDESMKLDAADWTFLNFKYDKSADVIVDTDSIYVLKKVNEKDIKKDAGTSKVIEQEKQSEPEKSVNSGLSDNGKSVLKEYLAAARSFWKSESWYINGVDVEASINDFSYVGEINANNSSFYDWKYVGSMNFIGNDNYHLYVQNSDNPTVSSDVLYYYESYILWENGALTTVPEEPYDIPEFDTAQIKMNGSIASFDYACEFLGKTVSELVSAFGGKYYAEEFYDAPGANLYFDNCPYCFSYSSSDGMSQAGFPYEADDMVTTMSLWNDNYEFFNGIRIGESKQSVSSKVGDVDDCWINETDCLSLYFNENDVLTWCALDHYVY